MENIDLKFLCDLLGKLSGIPTRLYQKEELIFFYSTVKLSKDPILLYKEDIFLVDNNLGYYITPEFDYYGIINYLDYKIIIGPSRFTRAQEKDLRKIAFRLDLVDDVADDFVTNMQSIVTMPFNSLIQILSALNYVFNNEKINLEDIAIYDSHQLELKEKIESNLITKEIENLQNQNIGVQPHNTLAIEEAIMNIVRKGDTAALKEWYKNAPAIRGGLLADNELRQQKNTIIVSATLVSRNAIRGGLDTEEALSLSDSYIQQCELTNTLTGLTNLNYRMIYDFTERVEKIRIGKKPSKLIAEVSNYIQHHLSDSIKVQDIADFLFISRSRLSTKFKSEAGINLNDFIMKEKIEEAKRLLKYSDKSLLVISSYLGFASQSHFSHVFKKITNKSPNEYREENLK